MFPVSRVDAVAPLTRLLMQIVSTGERVPGQKAILDKGKRAIHARRAVGAPVSSEVGQNRGVAGRVRERKVNRFHEEPSVSFTERLFGVPDLADSARDRKQNDPIKDHVCSNAQAHKRLE